MTFRESHEFPVRAPWPSERPVLPSHELEQHANCIEIHVCDCGRPIAHCIEHMDYIYCPDCGVSY